MGPIAVTLADKSGASLPLISGALLGGSMFGDNLSMISDTTIAATQSLVVT
jgi:Na+/H+ antiporter NhaC